MFSILRYPLFLSLVVDFAVAFELSWPNGSDFYVGNITATLSWQTTDPSDPENITFIVTDVHGQKPVNYPFGYIFDRGHEQSGEQDINIPTTAGNYSVSAYQADKSGPLILGSTPTLYIIQFNVQDPNITDSSNTGSASQMVGPSTSTPATPSPVTDLSVGPNKPIIIGCAISGFFVLVLLGFLFVLMIRRHRRRMESQKALQLLLSPNYLLTSTDKPPPDHSITPNSKAVRSPPPIDTDGNRTATEAAQMMVPRGEDDLMSTSHRPTAPPAYTSRAQSMITYIVPRILRRHSM